MHRYTSQTNPIRVAFLAAEAATLPGRIGITFAPGKRDSRWNRDLEIDLVRLCGEYNAQVLVSLIEDHELKSLEIPNLVERAEAQGLEVIRFPIRDVSVPASIGELVILVARLIEFAQSGRTILVHCRGGLGRAGLVAACCLVALGSAPDKAITEVRRVRPGAVETDEQESFVSGFVPAWSGRQR